MTDTLAEVEPLVYRSQINVPYKWWAGDTATHFFVALRDRKEILGTRCRECGRVYVPPRKNCPSCFREIPEWVPVSDEGVVVTYTIVRRQFAALRDSAPVVFALVKLDGADTALLHRLGEVDESRVGVGMRVKAVFADERSGNMRDIAYFRPVG